MPISDLPRCRSGVAQTKCSSHLEKTALPTKEFFNQLFHSISITHNRNLEMIKNPFLCFVQVVIDSLHSAKSNDNNNI